MISTPFPSKLPHGVSPDDVVKREIKRRRLLKKSRKQIPPSAEPPFDPPHWIPPGYKWKSLPRQLQIALIEFIAPAYDQLVAQVSDHLERSAGFSLVGLLWQEIVNQYDQGEQFVSDSFIRSLGNYAELLSRQLQLIDAKAKTSYILVRLREARFLPPGRSGILPLPTPEFQPLVPASNPVSLSDNPENCPNAIPVDQPSLLP